jgi:hypothetical protein
MKRQHFSHSTAQSGQESCIALIDARFLAWLQGQAEGAMDHVRFQLGSMLAGALSHSGLDVNLVRIYWYSDNQDDLVVDGQITRCVVPHNQDGGVSMLRALGGDLKRLAERGACEHVLIGSDDERLLTLIDDAQLHGMGVHLLADEAARNMNQLQRDDAGWARLLSQADRRIVLSANGVREGSHPRHGATQVHAAPAIDPEQMREQLSTVINAWWNEEPEDLREDLREELHNSRGIPQEVDRQLLLSARRVLERALSFHEKKMLREMVREVVLGGQAAPQAQPQPEHAE